MRKALALVLAAAATLAFSACSSAAETADEASAELAAAEEIEEAAAEDDSPEFAAMKPVVWEWAQNVYNEARMLSEMGTFEGNYANEVAANGDTYDATVALEGALGWAQTQMGTEVTKESLEADYNDITEQYEYIKTLPGSGKAADGLREEADITYRAYKDMYTAVIKPTDSNSSKVLESQALISGSVPIIADVCGESLN